MELVDKGGAIALSGRLDGRCSAEVREALYDHIEQHPDQDVVVDLTARGVDRRDRAAAAGRRRAAGGAGRRKVVLRGCSPALRRVLAFGGWRRLFRLERRRRRLRPSHPAGDRCDLSRVEQFTRPLPRRARALGFRL